jgi:uncharacterized membrane protein YwzB
MPLAMQFSFTPTCSLPPENTKFTSVPNVRGTFDIVWACFAILLLCTWSVQHLNIQPLIKARAVGQYTRLTAFLVKRKAKWMLLTLVAPEILIGYALSQFVAARHGRDMMQEFASEDGVEWTLEHSHFADMGGFVVRFPNDAEEAKSDAALAEQKDHSAAALSENISVGDPIPSLEGAPRLRRAVNLLPRGVISIIRTPMDPRTQSLSAPLSRGTVIYTIYDRNLTLSRDQRPCIPPRSRNRGPARAVGV